MSLSWTVHCAPGSKKTDNLPVVSYKACLVCGDKALGYNFNAISCESCKAFFRRNAFKDIKGRCSGFCEVTTESRSYCKRCRLKKCFAVGMNRDLILNTHQKHLRFMKINKNRQQRNAPPYSPCYPDIACPQHVNAFQDIADDSSMSHPSHVTHAIAADVDLHRLEQLTGHSRIILTELLTAFRSTFDLPMERQPTGAPTSVEMLNMADTSVCRLIKMAKQLKFFRCLEQEDQISLLKGAVVEVLILRSSKLFQPDSNGWQVSKDGRQQIVSAQSLKQGSPEGESFIQQYQLFVRSLLAATHHDNIVLMLLIVMTLLSPDRTEPSGTGAGLVSSAQEEYANAMRQYVAANYPHDPLMLPRLLQRLVDIRDMNEKHSAMLMNVHVDKLEPIITEIFDLV